MPVGAEPSVEVEAHRGPPGESSPALRGTRARSARPGAPSDRSTPGGTPRARWRMAGRFNAHFAESGRLNNARAPAEGTGAWCGRETTSRCGDDAAGPVVRAEAAGAPTLRTMRLSPAGAGFESQCGTGLPSGPGASSSILMPMPRAAYARRPCYLVGRDVALELDGEDTVKQQEVVGGALRGPPCH